MPSRHCANRVSQTSDRYLELIRQLPVRPILSELELDRAIALIDSLLDQRTRTPDEDDYLDVLSHLVERYEDEAHPLAPLWDADMKTK